MELESLKTELKDISNALKCLPLMEMRLKNIDGHLGKLNSRVERGENERADLRVQLAVQKAVLDLKASKLSQDQERQEKWLTQLWKDNKELVLSILVVLSMIASIAKLF